MSTHRIRLRPPQGEPKPPPTLRSETEVAAYLQDAARTPGGRTVEVALPSTEAEVAFYLRAPGPVLAVGAQSSVTGGATPFGERVLSTARLTEVGSIESDRVRLGAGVALLSLEEALHARGLYYPPAPTFRGAFIGGVTATNAAGAATFKYGTTRDWVRALCMVLASGDVVDIERGEVRAHPDGYFELEPPGGPARRVPVPRYLMPRVPKRSAGYHSEPGMDLVDLLIGSEGTLGVVTEVEVGLIREPCRFYGWVTFEAEDRALQAVRRLRESSQATWASRDPRGIDVAAIESMDRRCLEMLREDGKDREHGVQLPPEAHTALLIEAELPAGTDRDAAMDQIARLDDPDAPESPLLSLCRLLRDLGALDTLQIALPGDQRRAEQILAMREAVPTGLNHRVEAVQRSRDPLVHKTAADMIVPFELLPELMARYRESFGGRGLDHALWGHASDGNIHGNVIPTSSEDVRRGEEAILEVGRQVVRLGGCPLSEHGVGKSSVKQALLRCLYGEAGIEEMRRVKAAFDPGWKLAPGVLFPP